MNFSTTPLNSKHCNNVIDLFSGQRFSALNKLQIKRLSPEIDGVCMLYSTTRNNPNKLYSMKILCWGIRANGEVVGMIPWLNQVVACDSLCDPESGVFESYYDPSTEFAFPVPPVHKIVELESAAAYYDFSDADTDTVVQEIPDNIGTHAMLKTAQANSLILTEVLSWQLLNNGHIQGMLIDEELINKTPVLLGDNCLYPAESNKSFRYYFQHHIANQIKAEEPEAMAALVLLLD